MTTILWLKPFRPVSTSVTVSSCSFNEIATVQVLYNQDGGVTPGIGWKTRVALTLGQGV